MITNVERGFICKSQGLLGQPKPEYRVTPQKAGSDTEFPAYLALDFEETSLMKSELQEKLKLLIEQSREVLKWRYEGQKSKWFEKDFESMLDKG